MKEYFLYNVRLTYRHFNWNAVDSRSRDTCQMRHVLLLLSNPSDLNQIRPMRSFVFIPSNTKSGRLSRSSYTRATQSSRCCGVASTKLHFVQILNFLSPRENLRVFK
ncbi:hypothetical protein AVEN_123544-1 [Araneus ventricosus]|uniref:Uncharacterized protein n=1 Tax=Araneus ventricosus TaxID=182803 RepID=A0A4Y2WPU3_ARAVE|nr:hypothetical protein AVEN_172934-1 [Araneus ventricosus]GBO07683.1 hypothetical protein AVEN_219123-1 [Araneus ventricosus]GBO39111.1 hypothetical protein AVEN_266727-1 [Araneus ventricosus]GBO39115.1 hypothetical protein AVEN_123544-1 [Araneus ventricosus]